MSQILQLRTTSGLYGAERVILNLATALPSHGYSSVLGIMGRAMSPLVEQAKALGIETAVFPTSKRLESATVRAIGKAADRIGAEVIHAHDYRSLFYAVAAGAMTRRKVVATFHGETQENATVKIYERIARILANATQAVVAVSRELERRLRSSAPLAHVIHIPNGISPTAPCAASEADQARRQFGIDATQPVVSVIARLSPEKGHSVLFRALRRLRPRPVLLVAGDGPLESELRAEAKDLPVKFLGHVGDLRPVFAAADVVVLPSLAEASPIAALEAMAHGRCVLASAVGDLPEILSSGCGITVPPNSDRALSDALEGLLANAELRDLLARRAASRVATHYSQAAMAQAYARRLYAPLLGRRGNGPVEPSFDSAPPTIPRSAST